MWLRMARAIPVLLVTAFCFGPSACSKTMTIPEMKLRVVDEATGEPQEWVMVNIWAGQEHKVGLEYPGYSYYINDVFYLHAQNGLATIPARTFAYRDWRYSGCHIVVQSPLHYDKDLSCDALCRPNVQKTGIELRLKEMNDLDKFTRGRIPYPYGMRNFGKFEERMYDIVCHENILAHWRGIAEAAERSGSSEGLIARDFEHYVSMYLQLGNPCSGEFCGCKPTDPVTRERCLQLSNRTLSFYRRLYDLYPERKQQLDRYSALAKTAEPESPTKEVAP